MAHSDALDLLILDPGWRPCHRVPLAGEWRGILRCLLDLEGRWLALYQQRRTSLGPFPAPADIVLTRMLSRRLRALDMHLADHLIRAGEKRFSFRAAGLL